MGRRCCCNDGCLLIDFADIILVNDFAKVFTIQGDYTVTSDVDDTEYFSYDIITFSGSATLTLSRSDLIFGGDNFAITINNGNNLYIDNVSSGDVITELITFTLGVNTISLEFIRINSSNFSCSCIVKYNNTLLYTKQDNESTELDHILNNLGLYNSILNYTHYLIRKDGNIYYYFGNYLIGVCPDANINAPINFSYSFTSTNSNTTLSLEPQSLRIWKPDRWWKLKKYQNIPKIIPTNPSSSDANDLYNMIAYDEVEDEGCYSPESPPDLVGDSVDSTNTDVVFSSLSPKIAIQFSGFKGATSDNPIILAGVPLFAWYDDPDTGEAIDALDAVYDNITAEEDRVESINGLRTPIMDLDSIMTTQATAWQNAHYDYYLQWINGAEVYFDYSRASAQILNGVTGGDKVTFQQMTPVTVMYNKEWYYTDRIDDYNHSYHQGFRGYNASWGRSVEEWDSDAGETVTNYYSWSHVGGSHTNLCRLDPFSYYYLYHTGGTSRYSLATNLFAISDATLEFRRGIVAPDIDVNLSPHSAGVIDFIFNKPDTTNYSTANWRTPHIVDVTTPEVLNGYPAHGSVTKTWYETGAINPEPNRDPTSPLGGYFKLQYTTSGNITAETDQIVYELKDQFGAKSKGIITIHFTGNDTSVEQTVSPITSFTDITACSDYDTLCEVKCTIPFGLVSATRVTPVTVYLHYVHDGKTCQLSDLINGANPRRATLKIPSPWTSIDGTLQDTLQVTFVNPVHTDCDLAHDVNYGLENSLLQSGEADNVDHLEATVQIWDESDSNNIVADGQVVVNLTPTNPVGCPSSSSIGLSHRQDVTSIYTGTLYYSKTIGGSTYTDSYVLEIASNYYQSIPYSLGFYIKNVIAFAHVANHHRTFEVIKVKVVYVSGVEAEISLHAIASPDYSYIVLGDFYND